MSWTITYYSEAVKAEILAWPHGCVARYLRYADRFQLFGPDLGMPHTRAMGDGLFELRIKGAEGIARVLYCTVVGRTIVVLHAFVKKTEKTPSDVLATARRRMREVKDAHARRI